MSLELPQCILFDLDGTLVDSLPGIEFSVKQAFSICGLPLAIHNLRELVGPPIRTILSRAGNVVEGAALDTLEREFRASYDKEGWYRSSSYAETPLALQKLREQGHRLFVVSNKPRHISLRILEREGILGYFEAVVTRDSRSPHYSAKDEMIETLLADRYIAHDDCVVVGDTIDDANAAVKVGIRFVFMTHGYGSLAQIPSSSVWRTVNSFSQFLRSTMQETALD